MVKRKDNHILPQILVDYLNEIKEKEAPLPEDFIVTNKNYKMKKPHCLSMRFTRAVRKFKDSFQEKKKKILQ